jgi:hypothetical protein
VRAIDRTGQVLGVLDRARLALELARLRLEALEQGLEGRTSRGRGLRARRLAGGRGGPARAAALLDVVDHRISPGS